MLKVGSRVKFMSDTGTGIVRSIRGNIAQVEVDGFEIPALLSDIVEVTREDENAAIVRIGPSDPKPGRETRPVGSGAESSNKKSAAQRPTEHYGRISIAQEYEDEPVTIRPVKQLFQTHKTVAQTIGTNPKAEVIAEKAPFEVTQYDVKLVFVPLDASKAEASDLDAYIVNDSSYELYYNIAAWKNNYVQTIKSGLASANTKIKLKTYVRAELSGIITLHVSLLPFKATSFVPHGSEDFDLELHPLKFVRRGAYAENDYFDEPSIVFTLASSSVEPIREIPATAGEGAKTVNPKDAAKDFSKDFAKDKPKQPALVSGANPDVEVIDLHAENILDNLEGLTPGEILNAQMARFTLVIEGAIRSGRQSKIVFIHGVGKGKLKYEMKKILDRQYSKLRYQDASFAEYGYGAIMVFVSK